MLGCNESRHSFVSSCSAQVHANYGETSAAFPCMQLYTGHCGMQVCKLRNFVVKNIYSPRHFLDHANYDCGQLP